MYIIINTPPFFGLPTEKLENSLDSEQDTENRSEDERCREHKQAIHGVVCRHPVRVHNRRNDVEQQSEDDNDGK